MNGITRCLLKPIYFPNYVLAHNTSQYYQTTEVIVLEYKKNNKVHPSTGHEGPDRDSSTLSLTSAL